MLGRSGREGLVRSCAGRDWVRGRPAVDGVELLEAWFGGRAFDRHRHDTYAIGVTVAGVQVFEYRGRVERSRPGEVVVLHPDETHDGRPGDAEGFGYRIVYVEPARVAAAVRAITGRAAPLPFVRQAVSRNRILARAVDAAFRSVPEPLALDALVLHLTEGLLEAGGAPVGAPRHLDHAALDRARAFMDRRLAVVRSGELEGLTGLNRYELARQFRAAYGTSPYRYSLMRRLDFARRGLREGRPLADLALAAGFTDQAHFTRVFRATLGVTPGRYARLCAAGVTAASAPADPRTRGSTETRGSFPSPARASAPRG
jgi:AraC-like DNA-binding protein